MPAQFAGGMDVPPDPQDYPPPTTDDERDAPDDAQDATTLPWPQTRWSTGRSSNASIQDKPMCKHFYPEAQDNEGSDESKEVEQFDDATPRGSQEDNANENDHAQGDDDMDDASSASSHVGPPPMIDSEDDNEGPQQDRCVDIYEEDDEDEEIEQLPAGVIPSDDDDLDGFVRHRRQADVEAVYSRGFVDSALDTLYETPGDARTKTEIL
jgi:hypothetical protein